MKYCLLFLFTAFFFVTNAQLSDREIYDLKGGRIKPDYSPVYSLPFSKGSKFLLIQAYNSKMSHKSELSLDFKMHKGSKICAARDGIVTAIKKTVM
jgi:hypothetical protein